MLPPGFNTVTPYFFVSDAPAFITFLVEGLGGVELGRHVRDGRIANAHVRIGASTVMVSEASAQYPAMHASYYLYVENADEAMVRAVKAGAVAILAVRDMPYGDRQGGVRDKHENIWWISQRLNPGPY
ncbi:MAG: VOC family protein [Thermoanaerobaculia bacterium]|jgi:PhnB protein